MSRYQATIYKQWIHHAPSRKRWIDIETRPNQRTDWDANRFKEKVDFISNNDTIFCQVKNISQQQSFVTFLRRDDGGTLSWYNCLLHSGYVIHQLFPYKNSYWEQILISRKIANNLLKNFYLNSFIKSVELKRNEVSDIDKKCPRYVSISWNQS